MLRDNRDTGREGGPQGESTGENGRSEEQANGVSTPPGQPFVGDEEGAARPGVADANRGGAESASRPGAIAPEAMPPVAQSEIEEQRDRYLRLAAEFDNYRKRTARERQEAGVRAQGELLKRILDSLDDLDRATSVSTDGVDASTIVEGVRAVDQKLMRALADAGLEVLTPVDEPFNPEVHEAIATEPALSREDDHLIAQVYQPGYSFKGQLLRPARVVVKQWAQ
ncbi:MAG TPA: nucleotide exchange factor GrpE [Gemmatimonadaceae bacterium]